MFKNTTIVNRPLSQFRPPVDLSQVHVNIIDENTFVLSNLKTREKKTLCIHSCSNKDRETLVGFLEMNLCNHKCDQYCVYNCPKGVFSVSLNTLEKLREARKTTGSIREQIILHTLLEVFGEIHAKKKKTKPAEHINSSFFTNTTKTKNRFDSVQENVEKSCEDWPSHICLYQFGKFKPVQKSVLDLASLIFECNEKTVLNVKAGFEACKLEVRPVGKSTFLIKNVQKNIEVFKKISADKIFEQHVSETYLNSTEALELASMFVCNFEAGVPGLKKFSPFIPHLRNIMLQRDISSTNMKNNPENQECFENFVFVFFHMLNSWEL